MTTAILEDAAIEGAKVSGHSRHHPRRTELRLQEPLGQVKTYVAEHNVRATVDKPADDLVWRHEALRAEGDEISCDKAMIITCDLAACKPDVRPTTGTHKANHWKFTKFTHVRVIYPLPNVAAAIKRQAG